MGSVSAGAVVCFVSCIIFLASSSVAVAKSYGSLEDIIPSSLVVPEANEKQNVLFGTGVQIYVYNSTAWVLNNVSADLYNFKGDNIGHHFFLAQVDPLGGQATWETFHPFSRVTGKKLAAVKQSDSIDWLLLQATFTNGTKYFGLTNFIQRLFTQHGLPPAANSTAQEGDIFQSNYTSLYVFSSAKK